MDKSRNILIILFFMSLLFLPWVAEVFPVFPVVANTENRALKSLPEFSIDTMDSFPVEFDEYYSDHFTLRNLMLKLNSKIQFHWFNLAPHRGKAFIGKQGWMYLIKDEMELYEGKNIFTKDKIQRFVDVVNYRKHILDSLNSKYYLVVIPIKATVYPEFLPLSKSNPGSFTLTDQVVEALSRESAVKVIDLRDTLRNHKNEQPLFYKTDNHWNEYGAFIAYRAIMEVMTKDFPRLKVRELSDFKVDTIETNGKGLTNMMGLIDEVNEKEITLTPRFQKKAVEGEKSQYPVPDYFPYKNAWEQVYVTGDSSLPKLLVIRDSFGGALIPFLDDHFSKSVFIFDGWQHNLNEEILYHEKPDIYIQLVVEALLINLPENSKP